MGENAELAQRPHAHTVRVLLADEDVATREAMRSALQDDGRFTVCGEAGDAARAVEAALSARPDLCVLAVGMPGNGLGAAWEIAARLPRTRIVMVTGSYDDADLFAAINAGATGYLRKDVDRRRLPHALYDVSSGGTAIPRALVARMVERLRGGEARHRALVSERFEHLTSREWQILELLADGMSTQQIARRLVLSSSAVRAHISGLVRKLGAADRRDAVESFRRGA